MYPRGPKSEWLRQAEEIKSGRIPIHDAEIPALLDWLKDMNWPGAELIAGVLPRFGERLVPHLAEVLKSGDLVWIRWVLAALKDSFPPAFWLPLRKELERIASSLDDEDAHVEALYVLARCGWGDWLNLTVSP